MRNLPNRQLPLAGAVTWVAHITTIAMEMTVPPILGHFADQRLGTVAVFTILGALLGFAVGMTNLLQLAKSRSLNKPRRDAAGPQDPQDSGRDRSNPE